MRTPYIYIYSFIILSLIVTNTSAYESYTSSSGHAGEKQSSSIPAENTVPSLCRPADAEYDTALENLTSFLREKRKNHKKNPDTYLTMIVANIGDGPIEVMYIDSASTINSDTFNNAIRRNKWEKIKPGHYMILHQYKGLADIYALEKDETTKALFGLVLRRDSINIIRNGVNLSKEEVIEERIEKLEEKKEKAEEKGKEKRAKKLEKKIEKQERKQRQS